jgi:GNAT superfamily N-acetyltransferase
MAGGIRSLTEQELEEASALCLRSKAHWGYDAAFMTACRDELTLRAADLAGGLVVGLRENGALVGVAQVTGVDESWELEKVFVDPPAIGSGIGRRLFAWAVEAVGARGGQILTIAADPQAAEFYRRMGAVDSGHVASASIPGRRLPRLRYRIVLGG